MYRARYCIILVIVIFNWNSPTSNLIKFVQLSPAVNLDRATYGSYQVIFVLYRVIHKSLRNFRTRLPNNQDRQSRNGISTTCKIRQKLGVSLPLLTCSPSAWPSRLLYRRGRTSRKDLWITLCLFRTSQTSARKYGIWWFFRAVETDRIPSLATCWYPSYTINIYLFQGTVIFSVNLLNLNVRATIFNKFSLHGKKYHVHVTNTNRLILFRGVITMFCNSRGQNLITEWTKCGDFKSLK
jgi:hypothetical protein